MSISEKYKKRSSHQMGMQSKLPTLDSKVHPLAQFHSLKEIKEVPPEKVNFNLKKASEFYKQFSEKVNEHSDQIQERGEMIQELIQSFEVIKSQYLKEKEEGIQKYRIIQSQNREKQFLNDKLIKQREREKYQERELKNIKEQLVKSNSILEEKENKMKDQVQKIKELENQLVNKDRYSNQNLQKLRDYEHREEHEKRKFLEISEKMKQNKGQIDQLQQKLDSKSLELVNLENQYKDLQFQLELKDKQSCEIQQKLEKYQLNSDNLQKKLKQTSQGAKQAESQSLNLEKLKKNLENEIRHLKIQVVDSEQKQKDNQILQQEHVELKNQFNLKEEKIEKLEKQLDSYQDQVQKLEQQLKNEQKDHKNFERELEELYVLTNSKKIKSGQQQMGESDFKQMEKLTNKEKIEQIKIQSLKSQVEFEKGEKAILAKKVQDYETKLGAIAIEKLGQNFQKLEKTEKQVVKNLQCQYCHFLIKEPVTVIPCGHSYCFGCKRAYEKLCFKCGQHGTIDAVYRNELLEDLIAMVRQVQGSKDIVQQQHEVLKKKI